MADSVIRLPVLPVKSVTLQRWSFPIVRVVYRGYNNANANGGVSNANANNDASNTNTNVGSRLEI
ncbi:hypothetical protein LPH68_26050 [Bacteroides sp. 1_1_30]|uniref:hypothetical protein n=1 Tax=Bacteroidales TaxID=171549 RepID=UPI0010D6A850|nr:MULTISPECIES: hypothetical protein [Bacteroidales]MCD0223177.1 hypothetical protein [Bacteroides sp. 1_1_30]MCQ4872047.1 hypothetical protein [Butyricimonas paravirosa]RYU21548.1 hypothetical protein EAJ01_05240 [Bacteroides cellulosilyticus]